MTRFDIRLRRKQFTQSRIERHKNYQSLMDKHYEMSRKKTRGWMVVVFLAILIIALLLAFFNTSEKKTNKEENKERTELNENRTISKTTNTKVYKL